MSVGKRTRDVVKRAARSRWAHYTLSGLILAAVVLWLVPRRVHDVVAVDGGERWEPGAAPPRRHVVWQKPHALALTSSSVDETAIAELPDDAGSERPESEASELTRVTPHFANGGMTLLFAVRDASGQFDLMQSHRTINGWSTPEPLAGINTPSDELGPCLSRDGRELYFYSNRPGGLGGSDLYVATRTGDGWGEVQNLGPTISSSAHEYEPALSPDGRTLFFSSNRSRETATINEGRLAQTSDTWATTLRATPGETTFDLYAARRPSSDAEWIVPRSLSLNRPDSNEGAPAVSPDGAFLYFASDRAVRAGERANLDLYRARLRGDAVGVPENLGPTVNSPAHDTEPAFTMEGNALVFSTARDGDDRIYESIAGEVEEQSGWDASNLRAMSASPWRLLLVAALMAFAALLVVADQRDRLKGLTGNARYFATSVAVHVVLLMVLLFMKMPAAIDRLANVFEDEHRKPIEFEVQPTPSIDSDPPVVVIPGNVADLSIERDIVPEPLPRQPLAAVRPAERNTPPLSDIPRQPIRVAPMRPAALPAEQAPAEPDSKPVVPTLVRRTTGPRAVAPVDSLDTLPPVPQNPAAAAAPESDLRTEPKLERENVAVRNRAPGAMPLERLAGPTRGPAAMPREIATASPMSDVPNPAAVPIALAPTRASLKPAAAAINSIEETPLPAPRAPANGTAEGDKAEMRAALTVARTPSSLRAPMRGIDASATASRASIAPREPLLAERDIEPVDAVPRARGGVELAAIPRSRTSKSTPNATLLDDVPVPAAVVSKVATDTPVTVSGVSRVKIMSSRGGPGGIPQPARGELRPAAGRVEMARSEAPPAPAIPSSVSPIVGRAAAGPTGRPAAAITIEEAALVAGPPTPAKTLETSKSDEPVLVVAARAVPRGPGLPIGNASAAPATSLRPFPGVVASVPSAISQTTSSDITGSAPLSTKTPTMQIARAVGAPSRPLRAATLDEETPRENAPAVVGNEASPASSSEPTLATPVTLTTAGRQLPGLRRAIPGVTTTELMATTAPRGAVASRSNSPSDVPLDAMSLLAATPSVSASRLERTAPRGSRIALIDETTGLRSLFTMRQGDERKQYIELVGGTAISEKAVTQGLQWLKAVQEKDGSWSVQKHGAGFESVEGATGLALLPFLAAGQTHQSGEHREAVAAGVKWLVSHQQSDGALFPPGAYRPMYGHGIATIALCEAYGMTKDEALREPTARALDFIVKAQHAASGGWRYLPNESADTSVVGWQVMALKSGEMAGIHTPRATLDNAARWLASVESNKPVGGQFGYLTVGTTPAMTAEGLLCLQFLGIDRNDPRMRAGADFLMQNLPHETAQTSYYWYYATQVMYHMQGAYWKAWNTPMRDQIVRGQVTSGANTGTWEPRDAYELRAGRLYTTAMRLLILEVYYRHLPLYDQLSE